MRLGTAMNPHRHCSAPGVFSFHTSTWLFPLPQQWDATVVLPAAQTPIQKQPGQHRGAGWPQPTQEIFSLSTHTLNPGFDGKGEHTIQTSHCLLSPGFLAYLLCSSQALKGEKSFLCLFITQFSFISAYLTCLHWTLLPYQRTIERSLRGLRSVFSLN